MAKPSLPPIPPAIPSQVQERAADFLGSGGLLAGITMNLTEYNVLMEAVTLTLGAIAALFSLFFHIRRWYRGRKKPPLPPQ